MHGIIRLRSLLSSRSQSSSLAQSSTTFSTALTLVIYLKMKSMKDYKKLANKPIVSLSSKTLISSQTDLTPRLVNEECDSLVVKSKELQLQEP